MAWGSQRMIEFLGKMPCVWWGIFSAKASSERSMVEEIHGAWLFLRKSKLCFIQNFTSFHSRIGVFFSVEDGEARGVGEGGDWVDCWLNLQGDPTI